MRLAFRHTLHLVALVSALGACSTSKNSLMYEAEISGAFPGLYGAWKSDGYGFVFVVKGDALQAYEVTETTCVSTFRIALRAEPAFDVYLNGSQFVDRIRRHPTRVAGL